MRVFQHSECNATQRSVKQPQLPQRSAVSNVIAALIGRVRLQRCGKIEVVSICLRSAARSRRRRFVFPSFTRSWDNRGYFKTLGSRWIRPRSLFSQICNVTLFCCEKKLLRCEALRSVTACWKTRMIHKKMQEDVYRIKNTRRMNGKI